MDPHARLVCLLPCRSLTRYALANKEALSKILDSFLTVAIDIGLFQTNRQQWECLSQGARLRCFIEWSLPLIRASRRLSSYDALWLVEPHPDLLTGIAIPGKVALAKSKGKGCTVDHSVYHRNLSGAFKKDVAAVIYEETARHYDTRRE